MAPPSRHAQQFVHNSTYGILICKTCQYAIQKSALKSHLLRHKIYREEQKQLLSLLNRLSLLEPDDVSSPPLGSSPIEHLAVFSGYKCQSAGCGYLCVSTKRMKHHWRETHSEDCCNESDVMAVSLQTFFRGTKIRYFEVKSQVPSDKDVRRTGSVSIIVADRNTLSNPIAPEQGEELDLRSSTIDLEALRYFHHFTAVVCFTLPNNNTDSVEYWQKEVVLESLRLPWLMFGLLTISVHHILIDSDDIANRQPCWTRVILYAQEFQKGWRSYQRRNLAADSQAFKIGTRIACLLRCHHWNCKLLDVPSTLSTGQRIGLILENIQGCYGNTMNISENEILSVNAETQFIPIHVQRISSQSDSQQSLTGILGLIQSLPQRLALSLGKPKDIQDVHSVLSAIALLADSISSCISSERNNWEEIIQWLHATSGHFHTLILDQNAAAWIILSYWLMLFERVEQQYWFCHGISRMIQQLVRDALPCDPEIQSLIELFQ